MNSRFFNPWGELSGWPAFDQLFGPVRAQSGYPKVNVWKEDDHVVLTAELPGVSADALTINVHENLLTLSGECPARAQTEGETYHRNERSYGKFSRQLRLPYRADSSRTTAELKNGVLRVTAPPLPEDQPKQIAIKVD